MKLANPQEYAAAGYTSDHLFGPVRRCMNPACLETYTPRHFCVVCHQVTQPLKEITEHPSRFHGT